MKFLIDRHDLPYDAMVNDESWLCPVEEGDDDNKHKGKKTDTFGDENTARESREEAAERA